MGPTTGSLRTVSFTFTRHQYTSAALGGRERAFRSGRSSRFRSGRGWSGRRGRTGRRWRRRRRTLGVFRALVLWRCARAAEVPLRSEAVPVRLAVEEVVPDRELERRRQAVLHVERGHRERERDERPRDRADDG